MSLTLPDELKVILCTFSFNFEVKGKTLQKLKISCNQVRSHVNNRNSFDIVRQKDAKQPFIESFLL